MADFSWVAQGTDAASTNQTIGATDRLTFDRDSHGEAVKVGEYQDSTHVENSSEVEQCSSVHINNTKYLTPSTVSVNGGASEALSGVAENECPLKITFSHPTAVTLSNVLFWVDNGSDDSTPPANVDFHCAEQGDGSWTEAEGVGNALSISDSPSATSHDFFLLLSCSPTAVADDAEMTMEISLLYQ